MSKRWLNLNESDQAAFRATVAFLEGRLEERSTVDWALRLKPSDIVKQMALLYLFDTPSGRKIDDPWQTAWRLIQENWDKIEVKEHSRTTEYVARQRLQAGEKSGPLIAFIVDLVAPTLNVAPFSDLDKKFRKIPKHPKKVRDLFSTSLTSGSTIDPEALGIFKLTDSLFLNALALALEASVVHGLEIAQRIGWNKGLHSWLLGRLHRVNYVTAEELEDGQHEPDEFNRGIAPSTKLLQAVVSRLVDIDPPMAIQIVHRWKFFNSPVHLRLWASLSLDSRVMSAKEVADFLSTINSFTFWDLHEFPEIAELRARRFAEFGAQEQELIWARIRKMPPKKQWLKNIPAGAIKTARNYSTALEMRRIELTGTPLPVSDKKWLDSKIIEFPELAQMNRLDKDFPSSPKARWVQPNPDSQYDLLEGEDRLQTLESKLSTTRTTWRDDPAQRARDWISKSGNSVKLIADFELSSNGGDAFKKVWLQFGFLHSPLNINDKIESKRNLIDECNRVLSLFKKLSDTTLLHAVDGISQWISTWEKQIVSLPGWQNVWHKLWPFAVKSTNTSPPTEYEIQLNPIEQSSNDLKKKDLDTLNTSVGKFVGVFLSACPNLSENASPFATGTPLRLIRDKIITATGQARLISLHRLIESLSYFLSADDEWTQKHLIKPLIDTNPEAIALWSAIARRTQFSNVLKLIGKEMAERATDPDLDRQIRNSLVFSLVIECLHALKDQREPVVPRDLIQQMIRALDDEVRAHAAEAVHRFVSGVSKSAKEGQTLWSPEELFRSAASPFLKSFWPQERSLVTSGVSQAFADLPAASKDAFVEGVSLVERFLVPFNCWSMMEYGLYGEIDSAPNLSIINDLEKAKALLRLLDLTIGTIEGSVIPSDLGDALDQVRKIAPSLQDTKTFRRLATAARR